MKCSTSASGLKPRSNTMENRISQAVSSNQKNKVEDLPRSVKSCLNKKNLISECIASTKSAKSNKKNDWKPTIKVFTSVGYTWLPTGRTFTIDGIKCPMTKITSTKVVPPKETSPIHVITKHPDIKVYSRRPKLTKYVVQIVLWYLDSGCSKHIIGKHSQLINFDHKFLGTVRFGNDQIAKIIRYGDYQIGNVTISRVYYVEGLGHNLFFVGSRDTNLLSHLNFSTINELAKQGLVRGLPKLKYEKYHLCSVCSLGKSKKHIYKPKSEDSKQEKLYMLHMDLCGPMRIESINGKKYILVIIDDYSRFTWVKYLRSKDETPKFVIKFMKMIQVRLNDTVRNIRTDNGTKFVNQTLNEDLAKLKPKADIGIFIGYAPAKKAYRIYNRRTRLIMETIHVNINELTAMASEQFGLGPTLHEMTPGTISSGLVQNPRSLTPPVPPTKNDWDLLFQPMFNEYFTPPSSVVSRRLPPIIPQA
ncbi:retrovirus-related pol polyprotein from transposon TNT 1-94, partial [Tanacetum coccineum]